MESKTIQLVYVGRDFERGKLFHQYREILSNGDFGKAIFFSRKVLKMHVQVGTIIQCQRVEDGVSAPAKYIGKYEDEIIESWKNIDFAAKKEYDVYKMALKNEKGVYGKAVSSLKNTMKGMTPNQKIIFKLKVFSDLGK